jgi:light-regulated signal transduction histidine kinase (bacteriophytochrome)
VTVADRQSLAAALSVALAHYLDAADETSLSAAYDLGRSAVNAGMGLLDVALMFQDATAALDHSAPERRRLNQAAEFLVEALAPFEMTYRGYKDANEQLRKMAQRLAQQNRALSEATAAAEAANKDLEAFSYSVSHDLRAPVRHIDGFARLLRAEIGSSASEAALKHLGTIERSAGSMAQMIDDLLNLAQLDRKGIVRRAVDLNAVVAEVIRELDADTSGRTIEWRLDTLPTLDCDPGLVRIVFANLLANAVKYTRRRARAVIEVGYRPDNRRAIVFVKDNGAGFDPRYAAKLFGVFQRLHRQDEFEGTGVGLATVARIVRKHGGAIWADAAPDAGATFFFSLEPPLDAAAD